MSSFFQRLGKSLMLPVACLPVAGILIGIGYWLGNNTPAVFLQQAGLALIGNIPLLFAVGVAIGMSDDRNGVSALSGLVSWLVFTSLLSSSGMEALLHHPVDPAFGKTANVFTAILAGLIGAFSYNRFKDTRLPEYLSFFSGKRSVAIVSAGLSCLAVLPLMFLWPWLYNGLIAIGRGIVQTGAVGAGLYVFFNRLLIPLGLHHALNQVFWFDVAGINDLALFWSGEGVLGETGRYMSGFFPVMMFGLPAAALAMYHSAYPARKRAVGGILLAAALSSFLTGVTEPLEFSFMFLAPGLYLVHALLSGLTAFAVAALPVRVGFNFSAGLVDYLLSFKAPMALHPLWILPIGIVVALVYYLVFRLAIRRFHLKTLGREDNETDTLNPSDEQTAQITNGKPANTIGGKLSEEPSENPFQTQAVLIVEALGGWDNIARIDHCISRLRLELYDLSIVDEAAIKATRVAGIVRPGGRSFQIVIGPKVQFLFDEIQALKPDRPA